MMAFQPVMQLEEAAEHLSSILPADIVHELLQVQAGAAPEIRQLKPLARSVKGCHSASKSLSAPPGPGVVHAVDSAASTASLVSTASSDCCISAENSDEDVPSMASFDTKQEGDQTLEDAADFEYWSSDDEWD